MAETVGHQDFVKFSRSIEAGLYSELGEGKCLAFWANDFDPSTEVHHGNRIATNYNSVDDRVLQSHEVVTLADIEARSKGKIIALDDVESAEDKSPVDKQLMCALSSYAFAMSAKDVVLCSTKGAAPASYFRNVELDVVMSNDKVKDMVIANRDYPQGVRMPKREGYHAMRDQWVSSAIEQVKDLNDKYKTHSDNPVLKAAYDKAVDNLAHEMAVAKKMQTRHPFKAYDALPANDHTRYTDKDIALESNRVSIIQKAAHDLGIAELVNSKAQVILNKPSKKHIVEQALDTAHRTKTVVKAVTAMRSFVKKSRARRHSTGAASAKMMPKKSTGMSR